MYTSLVIIFFIISITLIALIMVQHGKDAADIGTSSNSISNMLFNSSSSGNFLTRVTVILAVLFFVISLILTNINSNKNDQGSRSKDQNVNMLENIKH